MENKRGSGIFLGIIGVSTLVVAIIGATFAFFSATASSAEDAVTAASSSVTMGYEDDATGLRANLIPSVDYVAKYAVDNMFKGKMLIIPGFGMKMGKFFGRFLSDKAQMKIVYGIQRKKLK